VLFVGETLGEEESLNFSVDEALARLQLISLKLLQIEHLALVVDED